MPGLPKQAGQLRAILQNVTLLKEKFAALVPEVSSEPKGGRPYGSWAQNRTLRYTEGSIEAIRSRGVSTLSMLEAMIDRRIYAWAEQSEETLMALNNDIVELKQQFKALSVK